MSKTFRDPRDGKRYRICKIGDQVWMAENLAYDGLAQNNGKLLDITAKPLGTYYLNEPMYGKLYGRLYTWEEAMIAAPPGWHLPTKEEWDELSEFIELDRIVKSDKDLSGKALKSEIGWNPYSGIENLDIYGFSALPGGNGNSDGSFLNVGNSGYWWSANEYYSSLAYSRNMGYNDDDAYWSYDSKSILQSVRCVQDCGEAK